MSHFDELTAQIRACGPEISDGTADVERLRTRFDAVEDLHRDLEGRRRAFLRGLLFGFAFGVLSVLWLGRCLWVLLS
jgi:hypothetical protein